MGYDMILDVHIKWYNFVGVRGVSVGTFLDQGFNSRLTNKC